MSAEDGAVLTEAMLREALEKLWNAPMTVCVGSNQHVVHPKAEGWTRCANCFGAVFVPRRVLSDEKEPNR